MGKKTKRIMGRVLSVILLTLVLLTTVSCGPSKEKVWTETEIKALLSEEPRSFDSTEFEWHIACDEYTAYRNYGKTETNYDMLTYYLFETPKAAHNVFDAMVKKIEAGEAGYTHDGNMIYKFQSGKLDGKDVKQYDYFYISGNLIILFDMGYDEELFEEWDAKTEEIIKWIPDAF